MYAFAKLVLNLAKFNMGLGRGLCGSTGQAVSLQVPCG